MIQGLHDVVALMESGLGGGPTVADAIRCIDMAMEALESDHPQCAEMTAAAVGAAVGVLGRGSEADAQVIRNMTARLRASQHAMLTELRKALTL